MPTKAELEKELKAVRKEIKRQKQVNFSSVIESAELKNKIIDLQEQLQIKDNLITYYQSIISYISAKINGDL